jgi:hypothetical protein
MKAEGTAEALIGNPDFGDLIQDTGGLRKIRMATGSREKAACG